MFGSVIYKRVYLYHQTAAKAINHNQKEKGHGKANQYPSCNK